MNIIWALVALGGLGIVTAILALVFRQDRADEVADETCTLPPAAGGCCGMHMTCERDSLLPAVSTRIVYYDDEELDAYKGVGASDYTAEAVEEFRDVLVTLREDDVAGWVRSLQLRGVEIPEELKPEIFLVVGEVRAFHMVHGPDA